MKVDILLGLQWGDEGKGKFVDALASGYQAIARFHGGSNAGHTLLVNGKKIVLNSIPSGILHPDILNIIGSGVLLDVASFVREIAMLSDQGYDVLAQKNLLISAKAHLLLPTHALLDRLAERRLGDEKIGSTQKGIAPAYADKILRRGLRAGEIGGSHFSDRLHNLLTDHAREIKQRYSEDVDVDVLHGEFMQQLGLLRQFDIGDTETVVNAMLHDGKRVLAEGAQATLLDIDHGTYPYVTSSNTTAGAACTGLGVAPKKIGTVYAVIKAYCTRVGNGPFVTEIAGEIADRLRQQGREFGSVTKRPRRIGWLDLPALKYAIMINGVDQLILTKADVLQGLQEIQVCTDYRIGADLATYGTAATAQGIVQPVYRTFDGWQEDISECAQMDDIPEALNMYMTHLEQELQVPIAYLSTGPDRAQIIPARK